MLANSRIILFIIVLKRVCVKVEQIIFIVFGTVIAYYYVVSNGKQ